MDKGAFSIADSFVEEFNDRVEQLSRLTNHPGSKGRFIELLLINLLRKYLPKKYDFSSGFYCSINPELNEASQQIDIICYDHLNYPLFFNCNEIVAVSPKSVKGLIEVKSVMTSDSIKQLLNQANCEVAKQLPIDTKFNLLSVKSQISPESVCKEILDFYNGDIPIVKGLGMIYSLDWEDIIVFDNSRNRYRMLILNNFNYSISSFVNKLIRDLYGLDAYMSVANLIGPSLFIPKAEYVIRGDEN